MKTWRRVASKSVRVSLLGCLSGALVFCTGCWMKTMSAPGKVWTFARLSAPKADLFYPRDVEGPPPPPAAAATAAGRYFGGYGFEGRRGGPAAGVPVARESGAPETVPPPTPMVPGGGEKELPAQPPPAVDLAAKKRLVIYVAQFSILVANVEDSMKALLEKIKQWDGFVQTSDLKRVTFRVPAAKFDLAVQEIANLGVVTNKQIQAEDVTRQFADLQLRLEVAEASRKRLMALLEKAQKAEDLLKIENEIRRLTEEIERMKAELRTLADQIAYSTVTVEFAAKAAEVKRVGPRRAGSYFNWINQIGAENVARNF